MYIYTNNIYIYIYTTYMCVYIYIYIYICAHCVKALEADASDSAVAPDWSNMIISSTGIVYTYVYVYIYIYMYIYIYLSLYIYIYTQSGRRPLITPSPPTNDNNNNDSPARAVRVGATGPGLPEARLSSGSCWWPIIRPVRLLRVSPRKSDLIN